MAKPVNLRCEQCSRLTIDRWCGRTIDDVIRNGGQKSGKIAKPGCWDGKKCSRKRSYYRKRKSNLKTMRRRHRYLKYAGDKCAMCKGKQDLEVHHIIPQSANGLDSRMNTMTLCCNCHKTITKYYKMVGWVK